MATKPKAASTAATEANAVAEEVESPQHHEAPIMEAVNFAHKPTKQH